MQRFACKATLRASIIHREDKCDVRLENLLLRKIISEVLEELESLSKAEVSMFQHPDEVTLLF